MKTLAGKYLILITLIFGLSSSSAYTQNIDSLKLVIDRYCYEAVDEVKAKTTTEIQNFRKNLEAELKLGIWVVGGAIGIALAILGFLKIKSLKDLKEDMGKRVAAESERALSQKIEPLVGRNVNYLQRQIDLGLRYQNSKILFIGDKSTIEGWNKFEIQMLRNSGLNKIAFSEQINHTFLDVDVVVYRYQKAAKDGQGDPQLSELLDRLKSRQPIPLIVYTGTDRMDMKDKTKLEGYGWFVFANMPLTLLTHIYNTANMFYSTNGQG